MQIGITGATGLVGRRLATELVAAGHEIVAFSRREGPLPGLPSEATSVRWNPAQESSQPGFEEALTGLDALVHLAGETVAQRWTTASRRRIRDSRIVGTRNLVTALERVGAQPSRFLSASAVGYYGSRDDDELHEEADPGTGFLSEVSLGWEAEAGRARSLGIPTSCLRIGVVLSPDGGALGRMLPPFRLGLGGRLGSGSQWMSWIHLADVVGAMIHLLRRKAASDASASPLRGAYNLTAPSPATNRDFTRALGRALGRPVIAPVPGFAMRLLFGEMADALLLEGQRVVPKRLLDSDFRFAHPELEAALRHLLRK